MATGWDTGGRMGGVLGPNGEIAGNVIGGTADVVAGLASGFESSGTATHSYAVLPDGSVVNADGSVGPQIASASPAVFTAADYARFPPGTRIYAGGIEIPKPANIGISPAVVYTVAGAESEKPSAPHARRRLVAAAVGGVMAAAAAALAWWRSRR